MNDKDEPSPGGWSPDHDGLDLALARRIDAACRRFEADWRGGRSPHVDDYLADVPEQGRPALRAELIALEQELCAAAAGPAAEIRDRLRRDPTISDDVRRRALDLAEHPPAGAASSK